MEGKPVAKTGEDGVPHQCSQSGEEGEDSDVHSRQTRRNGDQLTDCGYQSSYKGRYRPVLVELCLALVHHLAVNEAGMPELAVGKRIYDRTSYP